MLLDKLEIKGFKSFGERVVINFDNGVTAIVGPNGSGKSNVVDAIRWVLGEQSTKALRSDKMSNVIFNGTKNRRALQMAEVSLTFKNTKNLLPTEYSEVSITRRYFRSGESEYLLNGVTCRLKDIQNLFLDTGIGSNSYAIIELKMIDEILNDQNNSRRALFEEAAGISKFKQRKKETLKKLNETDDDLERVEDLLHEIGKNMRSLERQAKQAERFLKFKESYRELSIVLAKSQISDQIKNLLALNDRIQNENDASLSLNSQISEIDAVTEKEKSGLLQKEQLLSSRQKTLNEHVNKIRQFESDTKIKNERLRFLSDRFEKLQNQLDEDIKSSKRGRFSLEGLEKEQEQMSKMLSETEFLLNNLKAEYEEQKVRTESIKIKVTESNNSIKSKQESVYHLKKTLEINQVQLTTLKQELDRESSDTSEKKIELTEFDEKVTTLETQLKEKNEHLEFLQEAQQKTESQIAQHEESLKSLTEQLNKANRQLDASEHEYNLTKSMLDNLEGYPEAIRFLKKNTTWGKDALLVSDLITCDEKYRVAVENYLEPYLNFYVLNNESQALEAVNLLNDAAKGKGNFILLDKFKDYSSKTRRQYEYTIPALDIVEYDNKYKYLINYLLDDVYIVTEKQDELPQDDEATFITQNGKIIKKQYSLSGGSVGLFEGKKIGRAKNLDKLALKIKDLTEKISGLEQIISQREKDISLLKERETKEEIAEVQRQATVMNHEFIAIKTKKEQFAEVLEKNADKREVVLEQIQKLSDASEGALPQLNESEELLKELEDGHFDIQEALEIETENLTQKSAAYNQQNILFHQQTNKLDSLNKEIEYKLNTYNSGQARIENSKKELQHTESEIKALKDSSGEGEEELIQLYEEKESISEAVNEAEKGYYEARGKITELEKSLREIQQKKESQSQLLMQLKEQVSEARMKTSSVKERVLVEFEVDLEKELSENPDEVNDVDRDKLEEEVRAIKEKMDKMGAINHMAIDAYSEIKERNDFITEQREDLIKAKESLMQTISEIDTVARDNFIDAFTKIREHFIIVFRSLFTEEDKCDLKLTDPEDPLGSKIEIMAQPKGKRPLTINQLSGGEKTLTATALLFSIYLLKPAPFCIFDEVDAPLDDANIDKFNKIIRKFSEESQFIIVTHNKRTMSTTDVMYGITMKEPGVTTVVPVDLREIEAE